MPFLALGLPRNETALVSRDQTLALGKRFTSHFKLKQPHAVGPKWPQASPAPTPTFPTDVRLSGSIHSNPAKSPTIYP